MLDIPYIRLNNGVEVPQIGLGTYSNEGWGMTMSVFQAYRKGYHLFDTSTAYHNEAAMGRAYKLLTLLGKRRNFIVSTKLTNTAQRTRDVFQAFEESRRMLQVKTVDLYLMHWPNPGTYLDCWQQMEELYQAGKVRAIGVCNFHIHHLENLFKVASVVPAINQVELHPLLSQIPLRQYCKEHGIAMEAYTPLARMNPKLIDNPTLKSLAHKYQKTVPQIILRWDIQHDFIVIPKTSNPLRLAENIDLFDFALSSEDMQCIDDLNEDYRVRFDPDNCDYSKL